MGEQDYDRPELLAEPDWVATHADDPDVVVVDCSAVEAYTRAHIPGAVALPVSYELKDPDNPWFVMEREQIAALMGSLGIGDETTVVVYDDDNSRPAARAWWVLSYYGHTKTKVLNGGWTRWLAEGRPISNRLAHSRVSGNHAAARFTPVTQEQLLCHVDELQRRVGDPGTVILDVRSDAEWNGTNDRGNRRRGHIPGAVHLSYLELMTKDDRHVFRPADELRALLRQAGVPPEAAVVTY